MFLRKEPSPLSKEMHQSAEIKMICLGMAGVEGRRGPQWMLDKLMDLDEVKDEIIEGTATHQQISTYVMHLASAIERFMGGVKGLNIPVGRGHDERMVETIASSPVVIDGFTMIAKLILATARRDSDDAKTFCKITGIVDYPIMGMDVNRAPVSPTPTLRQDFSLEDPEQGSLKRRPVCNECRASFSNQAMLNRHQKTVHVDDKALIWKCGCGARFKNKTTLTKHRKNSFKNCRR